MCLFFLSEVFNVYQTEQTIFKGSNEGMLICYKAICNRYQYIQDRPYDAQTSNLVMAQILVTKMAENKNKMINCMQMMLHKMFGMWFCLFPFSFASCMIISNQQI